MFKFFKKSPNKIEIYMILFMGFSNNTRLKIILSLRENSLTVTEICKKTGFKQSRVSRNLKLLENCCFVSLKKEGNFSRYILNKKNNYTNYRINW